MSGPPQRPLAPRGRREAALAGAWIAGNLPPVDHIICSTAERTRQTLQATGIVTPSALVDFTDAIYEAYPDELLELVLAANPTDRTLLLIGHAPGVPTLAEELAGVDANKQRHEQGMNKRAEQAFISRRDPDKR